MKTMAAPTTAIVRRSVSRAGSPSVDEIAIASSPMASMSRLSLRQGLLTWLLSE